MYLYFYKVANFAKPVFPAVVEASAKPLLGKHNNQVGLTSLFCPNVNVNVR
jgi:hypothetical protein